MIAGFVPGVLGAFHLVVHSHKPWWFWFCLTLPGVVVAQFVAWHKLYAEHVALEDAHRDLAARPQIVRHVQEESPRRMFDNMFKGYEIQRAHEKEIVRRLFAEYTATHPDASPQIRAGTAPLPTEWVEARLLEMGEKWTWKTYRLPTQ